MDAIKKKELLFFNGSIFIFCFIALYFINQLPESSNRVDLGPSFFPSLIIWFIIVVNALVIVMQVYSQNKSDEEETLESEEKISVIRFFSIVILLIAYVYSWNLIDYKISTAILLIVIMMMLSIRSWKQLVFIPASVVLFIYLFFELLMRTPMP